MAVVKGQADYASRAEAARAHMAGSADAADLPPMKGAQGAHALDVAAKKFEGYSSEIDAALKEAEAAHYGRAASAANASIAELKPICDEGARSARVSRDALNRQAKVQSDTFYKIPREGGTLPDGRPTQIHPPEKNWAERTGVDSVPAMGWTSQYEERQERFQATNAEATRVMQSYTQQSRDITAPPKESQPQARPTNTTNSTANYGQSASSVMGDAHYSSVPTSSGSTPSSTQSAWASTPTPSSYSPTPTPSASTPSQAPANTSSAWAGKPNSALPPSVVRGPGGILYKQGPNGQWLRQNSANGNWAPVPRGAPVPGGGRAGVPGSGSGSGTGTGSGTGRSTGGGVSARGSTSAPYGPGGQAGRGYTPTSNAPSTTASSASTSSSSRSPMMRGAPMGNQNQNEDEETHERPSWLVETEDYITNDMERTAPPVLGALPDEDGYQ